MASAITTALGPLALPLAVLLLFFLPGFLLVNALFPRKGELDREYDALLRLTLGIVMSIVVTVLFGFGLNAFGVNPDTGLGSFTADNMWIGLSAISFGLFWLGWWRGAYPALARVSPALARIPRPEPQSVLAGDAGDRRALLRLRNLAADREALKRRIKDYERRISLHSGDAKAHYVRKRDEAQVDLRKVDTELRELERERAAELY